MKNKTKTFELIGLILAATVTTVLTNKMTERTIKKEVDNHFKNIETKEEA